MYYKESSQILDQVKSARKILLSCHHHPDSDTVSSSTVLSKVFTDLGKETKIICPDHLPSYLSFIEGSEQVQYVDFDQFKFEEWDLYIICDTASWDRLFINKNFKVPQIPIVVIDNHTSNKGFGNLNLLDYKTSSVAEMIYTILNDWNVEINKSMATSLYSGIAGDTGSFRYEVYKRTFDAADKLVNLGADIKTVNYYMFDDKPLELMKFLAVVIENVVIDPKGFCYAAINYDQYKKYGHLYSTREVAANEIIQRIHGTEFGFIMTEESPNSCSVSFRSRGHVDTSKIASMLGGGGHPDASGAWIQGTSFSEALIKVLSECSSVNL